MKPTEILFNEHRVIESVLDCLEKMAVRCEAGDRLDAQDAKDAIHFFRTYADKCHHGKEEDLLFPLMEQMGFPREGGPTGVMLSEHEQGRALVGSMDKSHEGAASDDAEAKKTFIASAREFVALLRQHIHKEDHCLFPMANEAFSDEQQGELQVAFAKVDNEDIGAETREDCVAIAQKLCAKCGVAFTTP